MATDEDLPTVETALGNAARLLQDAELETDLKKMARIEGLADSWLSMANTLIVRADRS